MLDTSIHIIKADLNNSKDQQHIIMLLDQYANDPMGGGRGLSDYTKANLIGELQKRQEIEILLAKDDLKAVGLLIAMPGFSTFACKPLLNIHDLAVMKEYRRLGIARKLMEEIQIIAIQKGCCKLTLEVLQCNLPALQAYEKFGFKAYQLDPEIGHASFLEKKLN